MNRMKTSVKPSYLELRASGYRFENHGVLLGDRPRDAAVSWYHVIAPDGGDVAHCKGIAAAYQAACAHRRPGA